MSDFMVTIYGSPIRGRGEDKMCWIPSKVKGFLVSDYYRILVGTAFFGFPWKSIWKQKIPSRVAFSVTDLQLMFLHSLYDWMIALSCHSFSNLLDLLDGCNFS